MERSRGDAAFPTSPNPLIIMTSSGFSGPRRAHQRGVAYGELYLAHRREVAYG